MTIKYTPYRGKIEPVTEIRKAEVTLHPEYIEVIYSYDYDRLSELGVTSDTMNGAYLIPREVAAIYRGVSTHQLDKDEERVPLVTIDTPFSFESIWIKCKSNKEADNLYLSLRTYLLVLDEDEE